MAKILFIWELGEGFGHMLKYPPLAAHFRDAGHEVVFALQDLSNAEAIFGKMGFPFVQTPMRLRDPVCPIAETRSYADILYNTGFDDGQVLMAQLRAWRTLYQYIKPDLVIFDHSPVAQLATRGLDIKRVAIGNGFMVPPMVSPFAELKDLKEPSGWSVQADEDRMVEMVNGLLETLGEDPVKNLSKMLEVDQSYLYTFKEFDHYERGGDADYWGTGSDDKGEVPPWPEGEGKKIFAYLKPSYHLPTLLEELKLSGSPTLIYASGISDELLSNFSSRTVRFARHLCNIRKVSIECDLAILNAGDNTAAAMLLSGVPVLQVPLHFEQYITARNIERLGAGLVLVGPEEIKEKLSMMLSSDSYAKAARKFAERYRDFDLERRDLELSKRILSLLD